MVEVLSFQLKDYPIHSVHNPFQKTHRERERERERERNPRKPLINTLWYLCSALMGFQVVVLAGGASKNLIPLSACFAFGLSEFNFSYPLLISPRNRRSLD
jgi:hypothetical protein